MSKKIEKNYCDLCNIELKLKDEEILNGYRLVYDIGDNRKVTVFRCKKCYEKDQTLSNHQECEVYTRIVGYLRPVKHFNPGKQQEFKERKTFKIKK